MVNKKQGFTLIKLLVVVLIIGILAAMALPSYFQVVEGRRTYLRAVERNRIAEAEILMGNVVLAQQRYKFRNKFLNRGSGYANHWVALDIALAGVADGSSLLGNAGDTFCTKGISNNACGNGFSVKLTGTSSSDNKSGVVATRTGNDQYGAYTLSRYYDDPSHQVYCTAVSGTTTAAKNSQALCIDFAYAGEYVDPTCVVGTDAYSTCKVEKTAAPAT